MALRRGQGAGGGVDHVAQFGGGLLHFFNQFCSHGTDTAQGTGGRDRADAGQARNFIEGRAARRAGIFIVLGGHQAACQTKIEALR